MRRAALVITTVALIVALPFASPGTGIPVVDVSAIAQAVKSNLQQAAAYAKQVQQLQTQLRSYAEQLKQGLGLAQAAQVWAEARDTMQQLQGVYQTYQQLTSSGGLQQYLSQFRDVNYYLNTPYSQYPPNYVGSVTQKQANDGFVRGIVLQEDALKQDAATVERMSVSAQGVQGQLQALEAANQFAQMQNTQLMEIRAILLQEQQAIAARMQTEADEKARREAATEQYTHWNYQPAQRISYEP
jgi:type IV secretion system protein TrbJ